MYEKPPIIPDVVEEHAEEAAILWAHRDGAVRSPDYDLDDLMELEGRLEAHLDGLRIAGDAGWETLVDIGWIDAGEIFATAMMAFESGDPERIEIVMDATEGDAILARGASSALGWLPFLVAKPFWDRLTADEDPIRRRIGIAAAAAHRKDPGWALKECLEDDSPLVRSRALRAVGELGRKDLLGVCRGDLEHEDLECRLWSAWTATLLGDRSSAPRLRDLANEDGPNARIAAVHAARAMLPVDGRAWLRILKSDHARLRTALAVAAAIGDPVEIPWILSLLTHDELAGAAGEAFETITGVNLEESDLTLGADEPEAVEEATGEIEMEIATAEFVEDEDDEDEVPIPDPDLVKEWWKANEDRFANGQRYLAGVLVTPPDLKALLRDGALKYRGEAAFELAMAEPGAPLFNVRARAVEQMAALSG
jgi:uncharacterized protein (TIGR02270 family)